jgi:hypothetical protein
MNEKSQYWLHRHLETVAKSDYMPISRFDLQTQLQHSGTFQFFSFFYAQLEILLHNIRQDSKDLNDLSKYPYECVVYSHTMRFKRYAMALARMFPHDNEKFIACYDGSYPILKSFFELMLESRMASAYLYEFGDTSESQKELAKRITVFADFNKKKTNYKHNFGDGLDEALECFAPESIKQYMKQGAPKHREDLDKLAKEMGGQDWRNLRHWYPSTNNKGDAVIKKGRPDIGSIRWCCEDILAIQLPDPVEKEQWKKAYVSIYEVLNTYSHPIQGYDDCLRPDLERLYDFFKISVEVLNLFIKFTLPEILKTLHSSSSKNNSILNNIDETVKDLITFYQNYVPRIEKQDREGFSK